MRRPPTTDRRTVVIRSTFRLPTILDIPAHAPHAQSPLKATVHIYFFFIGHISAFYSAFAADYAFVVLSAMTQTLTNWNSTVAATWLLQLLCEWNCRVFIVQMCSCTSIGGFFSGFLRGRARVTCGWALLKAWCASQGRLSYSHACSYVH